MQAVVGVLQARLHLPQASQLAQSPSSGNDKSERRCSGAVALAPSQFLSGGRAFRSRDSEPCPSCSSGPGAGVNVVCMVKERRGKTVSQKIKTEISEMLLYDKEVQSAVLPETALGADMHLAAIATINDVEMSKDLSVAKVYISIDRYKRGQEKALEALRSTAGYVRKGLAKRMNLKSTPEVRFFKDESLERGSRVRNFTDLEPEQNESSSETAYLISWLASVVTGQ